MKSKNREKAKEILVEWVLNETWLDGTEAQRNRIAEVESIIDLIMDGVKEELKEEIKNAKPEIVYAIGKELI